MNDDLFGKSYGGGWKVTGQDPDYPNLVTTEHSTGKTGVAIADFVRKAIAEREEADRPYFAQGARYNLKL